MGENKFKVLSTTLAEIYVRQGHVEKAKRVYEKLLAEDRSNSHYRERLLSLSKDSPEIKRLGILSGLLQKIEEKRDD
jgi:pentatricopeptide repeat protein